MKAAEMGSYEICEILIRAGSDPTMTNVRGRNAA